MQGERKSNQTDDSQWKKTLKELKKVWGAFDKEFEEATKGIIWYV